MGIRRVIHLGPILPPSLPVVSEAESLVSSVTGISGRRVQRPTQDLLPVADKKKGKRASFMEATNGLISLPSGTMKPLKCQPMKRLWWDWNPSAAPKSWTNHPPTALL